MTGGPLPGLEGVRVLDLTRDLTGAYCAKLLCDAGATVVKVEPPGGHPVRSLSDAGTVGDDGDADSAIFRFLAGGQQSVVVDLASAAGTTELRALAAGAHILLDDGALDAAVLEELRAGAPHLVTVSVSAYGTGGPRSGVDDPFVVLEAWSGSLYTHASPGREPLAVGGDISKWAVGAFMAVGAAGALRAREQGGPAAHVDLSALECLALTHVNAPALNVALGAPIRRSSYNMIPGVEPCKDGYVGMTTITAEQWHSFLSLIERPDLIADDSLLNMVTRGEHPEIVPAIHAWTQARTVTEVVEQAALFRIPSAPIGNGETLPEVSHLVERGVYVKNARGGFRQPRSPFRSSLTAPADPLPAPRLGEHEPLWDGPARGAADVPAGSPGRRPLEGVRVLDFSAFWAGPFATTNLGLLGADVIKVESIQRPDPARFIVAVDASVDEWYEQGSWYLTANLDKRGITLNVADPAGHDLVLKLVEQCDVVIENFTPRVMQQFGLDYEALRAVRPDLVMVRIPGFGLDGPWCDRPGFATTVEFLSGMTWITGYPDGPFVFPGICDPVAGMHAVFAILAALRERERSGRGQQIELTMAEMAANLASQQVVEFDAYHHLMTRRANRSPHVAPQGVYPCAGDGVWVALSVTSDAEWSALCAVTGQEAWARDPALATLAGRIAAHDEIDRVLREWCAPQQLDDVVDRLAAAGLHAAPVVLPHLNDLDAQMNARGFWEVIDHPVVGPQRYPGLPMRFSTVDGPWHRSRAPRLGEHTDEILRSLLGLGDAELASLREAKVTGTRPAGL